MTTSPDHSITVRDLRKVYRVPERESGLRAAVTSLVHRKTRDVEAVKSISFDIPPGEGVGLLGPTGAGKTTTLKMLAGLVRRFSPHKTTVSRPSSTAPRSSNSPPWA